MPKNNPMRNQHLRTADIPGSWFNDKFSQFYTVHPLKMLPIRIFDCPSKGLYDIEFGTKIESLPAESPLYDSFDYTVKAYFCPYRLYLPELRKNRQLLGTQKVDDIEFPNLIVKGATRGLQSWANVETILFTGTQTQEQFYNAYNKKVPYIGIGSLMERLGYQPGEFVGGFTLNLPSWGLPWSVKGSNNQLSGKDIYFQMLPLLAYWDIWTYAEYNKQDKFIPVVEERVGFEGDSYGPQSNAIPKLYSRINYIKYDDLYRVLRYFQFADSTNMVFANTNCANYRGVAYSLSGQNTTLIRRVLCDYTIGTDEYLLPGYNIFTNVWGTLENPFTASTSFGISQLEMVAEEGRWGSGLYSFMQNTISKAGLLPTTLYGDKFTTWFSEESIARLEEYKIVNNMTLMQVRQTNNDMYLEMLSAISGDSYVDYLQYVMDSALELKDHPIYVGSDTITFNMIDVLSQSQGAEGERNTSLGSTASKAYVRGKNGGTIGAKPIKFKTREPGLLLFYGVLTPRVRYYQGEDAFFRKQKFASLWHPQYDAQGFDDIQRQDVYKMVLGSNTSQNDIWFDDVVVGQTTGLFDNSALSRVPVGWEYMKYESRASAGARLPWMRPWSLVRDFNDFVSGGENENKIPGSFYIGDRGTFPKDDDLITTYGNEQSFNYNFANVGQESENFVVLTEFEFSRYIPISKNLLQRDL